LLEVLEPFKDHLNIYFEGHSDSEPVQASRTAQITDNFSLSSMRANSALQFAREHGFPENHLYIAAMGANSRNSRTLSIKLEARSETK
jgi:flagellar motor protein MotB